MPVLVTIVVTVYRRERYLRGAVESALAQTVPVEVCVLDDAAPGTAHDKLIEDYLPRVRYLRNAKSVGLVGAFNRSLEVAETPYVSILHDDDRLRPDAIQRLLEAREAFPGQGLYFGNDETLDENGEIINRPPADETIRPVTPLEFTLENQFSFPGHLLDREIARRAGGFTSTLTMTSDWDLWLRLAIQPGAVKTGRIVAQHRQYWDEMRATSFLDTSGRRLPSLANQLYRNRRHLRAAGLETPPRAEIRGWIGRQARVALLDHGWKMQARARYVYRLYCERAIPESRFNRWLYRLSPRLFGWVVLGLAWIKRQKPARP